MKTAISMETKAWLKDQESFAHIGHKKSKSINIYSFQHSYERCFYLLLRVYLLCKSDTGSLFEGETRSDAILIHGVNEMSTEDVFAYFRDFAPGSVEWIDDSSCKSLISVI